MREGWLTARNTWSGHAEHFATSIAGFMQEKRQSKLWMTLGVASLLAFWAVWQSSTDSGHHWTATAGKKQVPALNPDSDDYACPLLSSTSTASQLRPVTVETTKLPVPTADVVFNTPRIVAKGTCFDGRMRRFTRNQLCAEQLEGGKEHTVFLVDEGATLQNVIIGKNQREGVYCLGSCTIRNVWWEDVCEDALTARGNGNVTVYGGGAFKAEDKVIQHNGLGTVTIEGFYVEDFGKLYRSCGNCKKGQGQRHAILRNVVAVKGKALVGINQEPYRDTATLINITAHHVKKICKKYLANSVGEEPVVVSERIDGIYCKKE